MDYPVDIYFGIQICYVQDQDIFNNDYDQVLSDLYCLQVNTTMEYFYINFNDIPGLEMF